jgi:hypothetical protein
MNLALLYSTESIGAPFPWALLVPKPIRRGKRAGSGIQQALAHKKVFVYFEFPEVDHDWTGE